MVYVRVIAIMAALISSCVVIARRFLMIFTVQGNSMMPTFRPGDRVLLLRQRGRALRSGRIIVIAEPNPETGWNDLPVLNDQILGRRWSIKRIVALAGDPVPKGVGKGEARVPCGHLVVLSDNPSGKDSRAFGFLPIEAVLGTVICDLPGRDTNTG